MTVLFWSVVLISSAFILHLVLWRVRLPKRQIKTLLLLFFGVLIMGIVILSFSPITLLGIHSPSGFPAFLHISLFFTAFTLAYMITYTAMEADSPSLVIINKIAEAGSAGMTKEDFFNSLNDDVLVKPRINDLLRDKIACLEGDLYRLTPKGIRLARIFVIFRSLLNAEKGG